MGCLYLKNKVNVQKKNKIDISDKYRQREDCCEATVKVVQKRNQLKVIQSKQQEKYIMGKKGFLKVKWSGTEPNGLVDKLLNCII